MKRRGWLVLGCTTALTLGTLQMAVAHESNGQYNYGHQMMGGPGYYGPGYGNYGPGGDMYSGGHHKGRHHGTMMGRDGIEDLDLSDEQRSSIRKIMRDARKDFRRIQDKLSDKRYALYDLIEDNKGGKEADALADAMGDLMAERIKLRTAMRMQVNKVLNKEQREAARDIPFFGWGYDSYR